MSLTQNFDYLTATKDYAAPKRHELPDTYPKGRRCVHETGDGARCITILHRYHEGPWCHAHEGKHLAERLMAEDGVTFHCGTCGFEPPMDCDKLGCPFHA